MYVSYGTSFDGDRLSVSDHSDLILFYYSVVIIINVS